jgi:hypothetical protein
MEVRELAPGLWRWTTTQPELGTTESLYWEGGDAVCLFDPYVPVEPDEAERFWRHLDADVARNGAPVAIFLTSRPRGTAVLELTRRYEAAVHGPERGLDELPGGVTVAARGSGRTAYRVPASPPLLVGRLDG